MATFVVPTDQCCVTLNGVHRDAGHQGQARTLALAQERFWWPSLVEDCKAMIRGCQHCHAFEGAIPKALLCPIRAYTPLELMHMDFMSIEMAMELNKPPAVKNVLVITDHFTRYAMAFIMKDKLPRQWPECYMSGSSLYLEHQQSSSVTGEPTSLPGWSRSSVQCLAFRNAAPPHIMPSAMVK